MSIWAVLGITAGVLAIIDPVPYVRDILAGTTRPHRGTWCIWSVLGTTAFAAQLAEGASWSLLMVGIQALTITVVFVLSIGRGVGGVQPVDLVLIGVAGVGLAGWFISSEPLVATVFVIVADLAGVALMLPKTWRDPHSETLSTFALAGGSGLLATAAVGALDPALLLYPAYFGVINSGIAAVIAVRRGALLDRYVGQPTG